MQRESGVLKKWFEHEMTTVHRGLVTRKKSLESLLKMDEPHCLSREDQKHTFDKEILNKLGECLPEEGHTQLKLPITLNFSLKVENECYISDDIASEVIRKMEGYEKVYQYRDGKMWLPNSIGLELIRKYKGAIQQLFLP
ncbi:MAG: DUF61 family protein [Methanobacteriota archaeon]|nr:MAG: DUF61 family protein [Euryarchaeota archaeon]